MAFLMKMLPIQKGDSFTKWSSSWLVEVKDDLFSVIIDDAPLMAARLERLSAYLPTMTTMIAVYRIKVREERNTFYTENPKPESGIRAWEEKRDATTAQNRYVLEFLEGLHTDLEKRVSTSQTLLNFAKAIPGGERQ